MRFTRCECGKRLEIPSELFDKRFRCPHCDKTFLQSELPAKLDTSEVKAATEVGSSKATESHENLQHVPVIPVLAGAMIWSLAAWLLASLAPQLGFLNVSLATALSIAPLCVTTLVIGYVVLLCFRILLRTGQTFPALSLAWIQLLLFTTLFYQIACHLGAEYYSFDQAPTALDWFAFSLAHALRAWDFVDALDVSGISFQWIHSGSWLVATTLVVYHFVVDIFILTMLATGVSRLRGYLLKHGSIRSATRWALLSTWVLTLAAWCTTVFWLHPWQPYDIPLWLLDNVAAVVDFTDLLEIQEIDLHGVPMDRWEAFLAIVFRTLAAIALAGLFERLSRKFRLAGLWHFAISKESLEEVADQHRSKQARKWASSRLSSLESANRYTIWRWETLNELAKVVRRKRVWVTVAGLLMVGSQVPARDKTNFQLTRIIVADESSPAAAQSAMLALRKLGPHARSEISRLEVAIFRVSDQRATQIIATLPYLGPEAVGVLDKTMQRGDEKIQAACLAAVLDLGPSGALTLVKAAMSEDEAVRSVAAEALTRIGASAAEPLVSAIDRNSARYLLPVLIEMDPYWGRRQSDNQQYAHVRACWNAMQILEQKETDAQELDRVVYELVQLETFAIPALPTLVRRCTDEDHRIRDTAKGALWSIWKDWATMPQIHKLDGWFSQRLQHGSPAVRLEACWLLERIEPLAVKVIPDLLSITNSEHELDAIKISAARILGRFGSGPDVVLGLITCSLDRSPEVRLSAAKALAQIGGERANAQMIVMLDDEGPLIAAECSSALEKVKARLAMELAQAFDRADTQGKERIATLIQDRRESEGSAVPWVLPGLVHPLPGVRDKAGRALDVLDPAWRSRSVTRTFAQRSVSILESSGEHGDALIAIETLQRIGPKEWTLEPMFRCLIELEDSGEGRRIEAAMWRAIHSWRGSSGHPTWPQVAEPLVGFILDEYLNAGGRHREFQCEKILVEIGGPKWPQLATITGRLDELIAISADSSQEAAKRERVVRLMGELETAGQICVSPLVRLVEDDENLRAAAANALATLANPENQYGRRIDQSRQNSEQLTLSQKVVKECRTVLNRDRAAARAAIGVIAVTITPNQQSRTNLGPTAEAAVSAPKIDAARIGPDLVRLLGEIAPRDRQLRQGICRVLSSMGSEAEFLVPQLKDAVTQADRLFGERQEIYDTLRTIEKAAK